MSPADFEDLARDLIGRELGVRFEAFGPGPDGGIDGRHASAEGATILQAKHYRLSDFAALARVMRRERKSIDALGPARYVLVTSRPLLPDNKDILAEIVGPALGSLDDILGCEDVNGLLRQHPEVVKSHVKLWLSSAAVLERVLHAASHNFTTLTERDIRAKLKVFAENPSLKSGRDILEKQRMLIVSGPPGVGKTTLAEMLCYAYLGEEWELISIRNLEEGFARIDDAKRQVFFFDDFLGRIALDERALSKQDSDLARFISRVRRTPSARFILTTRAYIYEQARLMSEALSDSKLNVSRYVLDVGIYTRRIRARILYNHLIVAGVPEPHIAALLNSGAIKKIVDHDHYNPRIIEWMTEADRLGEIAPTEYPDAFLKALKNPERIWDKAFRTHIPRRCQHVLISLFLCSDYSAAIEDVEEVFCGIHPALCRKYAVSSDPKDFEDALRAVEGSFIVLENGSARFVNPSVRDYLAGYLKDVALLKVIAEGVPTLRAARNLHDHFKKQESLEQVDRAEFTRKLVGLCSRATQVGMWRPMANEPTSFRIYELSNIDRIELLVEWWRLSDEQAFLRAAEAIAQKGGAAFSPWSDGRKLPVVLAKLRTTKGRYSVPVLAQSLETALSELLDSCLDPDDIERVLDSAEKHQAKLPPKIFSDIDAAIRTIIETLPYNLDHIDAESTLDDWHERIEKLGERVGAAASDLRHVQTAIESRLGMIREAESGENDLSFTGMDELDLDLFDDDDLSNLFAPLVSGEH